MTARIQTDLPISAELAQELAQKPATFLHVVWPFIGASGFPPRAAEGDQLSARLRFFCVLPAWRHRLRIVHIRPGEIYTNESGGPVRTWNHRLTFAPTSAASCRYTDEVEVEAGALTPIVWLFVQLMFRYRQARWRRLAAVLA
jgi:hypothetical protein